MTFTQVTICILPYSYPNIRQDSAQALEWTRICLDAIQHLPMVGKVVVFFDTVCFRTIWRHLPMKTGAIPIEFVVLKNPSNLNDTPIHPSLDQVILNGVDSWLKLAWKLPGIGFLPDLYFQYKFRQAAQRAVLGPCIAISPISAHLSRLPIRAERAIVLPLAPYLNGRDESASTNKQGGVDSSFLGSEFLHSEKKHLCNALRKYFVEQEENRFFCDFPFEQITYACCVMRAGDEDSIEVLIDSFSIILREYRFDIKMIFLCESGDSDRIARRLIQRGLVYDVLLVRRPSYDLFELTIWNSAALIVCSDRLSMISHGYLEALGGRTRVFFTPMKNSFSEPSNDQKSHSEEKSLSRADFVNILYNFLSSQTEDIGPEYVVCPSFDRKEIVSNVADLLSRSLSGER